MIPLVTEGQHELRVQGKPAQAYWFFLASGSENNALFARCPLSFIPPPDLAQQFLYAVNSLSFRESNDSLMVFLFLSNSKQFLRTDVTGI